MARPRPIRIERLEDRSLPAVFGYPWPDARRLTISFVPDGTPLGPSWTDAAGVVHAPATSSLFASQSAAAGEWQREILRAFQTWAARANVDLQVVPDSGEPLGTPGAPQGDPRFGDVRVAAGPLSLAAVSSSVPYSPAAGTWSGDLLFNTRYAVGIGADSAYDLYSVALHEAGHMFGIAGTLSTPDSVMFEFYNGPRADLGAAEVDAMQSLYGEREPDRFEGEDGNDSLRRATPLRQAAWGEAQAGLEGDEYDGLGNLIVAADLTTPGDVDVYRYQSTRKTPGFTVRVEVGELSLLNARLSVLDATGHVVATTSGEGDLALRVEARPGARYFLRVEGADGDVFSVGAYRLRVEPDAAAPARKMAAVWERFRAMAHDGDSLRRAVRLRSLPVSRSGRIGMAGDVDYYRLRLPRGDSSLSVLLRGGGELGVSLLDRRGRVITSEVGASSHSLRWDGLEPGEVYYLAVTGAEGVGYRLSVQGDVPATVVPEVANGSLSASAPQAFRGLLLPRGGLMHLEFALGASAVEASAEVALFDHHGNMVHHGVVQAGRRLTWDLMLPAGAYSFRLVAGTADGSALAPLGFVIRGLLLSDPIGPPLVDPTTPTERYIDPVWFGHPFWVTVSLIDPYGRPVSLIEPPPVVGLPPGWLPPGG